MHWNINEGQQFAKGAVRGDTLGVSSQMEEQMTVQSPGKSGQQEPPKQTALPLMQETPVEPTVLFGFVRTVAGGRRHRVTPTIPNRGKVSSASLPFVTFIIFPHPGRDFTF